MTTSTSIQLKKQLSRAPASIQHAKLSLDAAHHLAWAAGRIRELERQVEAKRWLIGPQASAHDLPASLDQVRQMVATLAPDAAAPRSPTDSTTALDDEYSAHDRGARAGTCAPAAGVHCSRQTHPRVAAACGSGRSEGR
jgi:hypothetical protein